MSSSRGGPTKRKLGVFEGEGKVVTVFNFKGGAAKTTLVAHLAAAMVKSGGDRLGKQPKVWQCVCASACACWCGFKG